MMHKNESKMEIKKCLLCLTKCIIPLLACLACKAQCLPGEDIPFDKYATDTIHLKEDFKPKKVVAYKYRCVTFYVDYDDCKKAFTDALKIYNGMGADTNNEEDINEEDECIGDLEKRRSVLSLTVRYLEDREKISDTICLTQARFDKYELEPLQNFLPEQIEKGTCSIVDENNNRHFTIIRQQGSWYRGPRNAWGGRRYFLPGHLRYFIDATDWIS